MKPLLYRLVLAWLAVLPGAIVYAQAPACQVWGYVRDTAAAPMPSAVVQVPGQPQLGSVANEDGMYRLNLPPGTWQLQARYLGYAPQRRTITVAAGQQQLRVDFELKEDVVTTEQVVISSDGRDPAYTIMEQVIARRDSVKRLNPDYSFEAYTKTKIDLLQAPATGILANRLPADMKPDSTGRPKSLFFSETRSTVKVSEPGKATETITDSRVSGRSQQFSLFGSLFLRFSIYDQFVEVEGLMDRGLVSPLADQSFFYYQFKLLGSVQKDSLTLYKIALEPRRPNDPCFTGTLWVADGLYLLESYDLELYKRNQLNFVDTVRTRMQYQPLAGLSGQQVPGWKPVSVRFDLSGGLMGVRFGGYSASYFSRYQVVGEWEKNTFGRKVLEVADTATGKPADWWDTRRPLPLDSLEAADYQLKDSLETIKNSPAYQDSLTRVRNKFRFLNILTGYSWKNYRTKGSFYIASPLTGLSFNSIEGYNLTLSGDKTWRLKEKPGTQHRHTISFSPTLRYGFANRQLSYQAAVRLRLRAFDYDRDSPSDAWIEASGGDYIQQFAQYPLVSYFGDALYTVLGKLNYLRLYQRRYAQLAFSKSLVHGLRLTGRSWWEWRRPLAISDTSTWAKWDSRHIQPNYTFASHHALSAEATLEWDIAAKYISTPRGNIDFGTKWPTLWASYRHAIPVQGSSPQYGLVRGGLRHTVQLRLAGQLDWAAQAGIFVAAGQQYFMDWYHFPTTQMVFAKSGAIEHFATLDFYQGSTNTWYIHAHARWNLKGWLFQKIPGIRKLHIHEVLALHYLYSPQASHLLELQAGLANIGRVLELYFHWRIAGDDLISRRFAFTMSFPIVGE